jgi:hypothetical protein
MTRIALPTGSRFFTNAVCLVTLAPFYMGRSITDFQPGHLLQWLSFMPQLGKFLIIPLFPFTKKMWKGNPMQTTTPVTFPNRRWFDFQDDRVLALSWKFLFVNHHPSPRGARHSNFQSSPCFRSKSPAVYQVQQCHIRVFCLSGACGCETS